MKVHLIAIGGSAMHNMALALHHKGFEVSGSDDAIFEPSKSRLQAYGLLPKELGWFTEKIHDDLDAIILGMHARIDNPELLKAQEKGIPIYSYPEYIYEQSKNKKRVVIGGSHGKTSITAIVLHVLKNANINCDFMVGAQLDGFDTMVKLSDDASIIVLEGDEYLSSPIDLRPKFHWYKPHLAVISGIAWDHINVFPTFENYVDQFRIFKNDISEKLFYYANDEYLQKLSNEPSGCQKTPYDTPNHIIENGITYLIEGSNRIPLQIFGIHNLQNIQAAQLICQSLGVDNTIFYESIQSFNGAAKRLELVKKTKTMAVYKDFAHSPSKLKATTEAMKNQYPNRLLVACMELHTYSSLNKSFLREYKGSMNMADLPIVFISQKAIQHKKLEEIKPNEVYTSFGRNDLKVITDSNDLKNLLNSLDWKDSNLLMMSSGTFDGLDLEDLAQLISD
ncbi:MAG: UDP-N-acetylmuramate--L-alanine ligase [Flavobacteriales bacterium]